MRSRASIRETAAMAVVWVLGCNLRAGSDHVKAQADVDTVGQNTVTTAHWCCNKSSRSPFGQCRNHGRAAWGKKPCGQGGYHPARTCPDFTQRVSALLRLLRGVSRPANVKTQSQASEDAAAKLQQSFGFCCCALARGRMAELKVR